MESKQEERFENFRKHILPRVSNWGMLFCGSFYEQPLEYAMLNLTDLDHMSFDRTQIALAEKDIFSKYFHGEILTLETNSCHLGFARLLRLHKNKTEYVKRSRNSLDGPAIKVRIVTWPEVRHIFASALKLRPNLNAFDFKELKTDWVSSVLCLHWPSQANEWIIRERSRGWPTTDIIEKIVAGGCHLVAKSHQSNPTDDSIWRFSFSQAEVILLNSWNEVQKYIYHILRLLKSNVVAKCGGKEKTFLCTYHFKTLMLWASEKKRFDFWSETRIESAIEELLLQMIQWLTDKTCPNYFIRKNNMLDHLQLDHDTRNEILLLHEARKIISTAIALQPKVYRGKMFRVRVSDKALLLCQLSLNRQVFYNAMNEKRERFVLKNLSSSALFRQEVEDLFRAVQLHRLLMNGLLSSEVKINERRETYETECVNYFHDAYKKRATRYRDILISLFDSLTLTVNKFLHGSPREHSQRMCCYRRTDEGNLTKEAMEALCQAMVSTIDSNHHNPSFLITAAYFANFYYTGLQDYRQALLICEEALLSYSELMKSISLNTIDPSFSNEILCVFINREYIDIFDAGIQVVFGFLVLCMATLVHIANRHCSRRLLLCDLVFQVYPVQFLEYIGIRCRNMLRMSNPHCMDSLKIKDNESYFRRLPKAILSAALGVYYNSLF